MVATTPSSVSGSQPATSTTVDEDREGDVSGQHDGADAADVGQAGEHVQRRPVGDQHRACDPLGGGRQAGQPRERVGGHGDQQTETGAQCRVGSEGETQQ